jgi:hypothetical protein
MRKTLLLSILIILLNSCNFSVDFSKKRTKKIDISGIVVEKYRELANHNLPCVDLNSNNTIGIDPWNRKADLWGYIQIGDSVYKPSGTLNLKVVKPTGESKVFEYDEE